MSRRSYLLPLGALLLAFLGTALLQARAEAEETYLWTFDNKAGDTEKFRTYIKITGKTADGSGEFNLNINSASKHTYKDVSADGAATYEQLDEKFEGTFNGMPLPFKPEETKPVTLVRGKNGIFVKRTNPGVSLADAYREKSLLVLQSLPAPEKPVKIGESWTATMPNPMLKSKIVTATSTLVGTEKVLGQDALKISLKMDFPSALDATENEIIHLDETYDIDAKTHQLLRARYTIQNPVLPFPKGKSRALVFVTRIITGVNEAVDPDEAKWVGAEKTEK
jgi:hypothetical protein